MKTKKIIADTMPQALKMVRQQLGDNAIIVNTRAINTGGIFGFFTKQKYEVTAYTMDKEEVVPESPKKKVEPIEKQIDPIEEKLREEIIKPDEAEKQNSVFHKSPQKLYQLYSQPESVKENQEPQIQTEQSESVKDVNALQPPRTETVKPVLVPQKVQSEVVENELLTEMKQMRKMMMTLLMGEKQGNNLPSGLLTHLSQLRKQGVTEEVIEYIVNSFIVNNLLKQNESVNDMGEDVIKKGILNIIEEIISKRISHSTNINETTRMINLIGPTGVGKTTSIAKLATEQILKQKRRVALITTDVYRIAAVEQLKMYAGILNVPIEVVHSANELDTVMRKLEHFDLIYMDTTGRNYKEVQYRESINGFINHSVDSENYLVLSLTTKYEDLELLLNEFIESPVKKLILTKFDETSSYGSMLNIAYKYPYQLAYITNGQSVPEDITRIDPTLLARNLLGEEK
jgi:flagellar biosynthesis protein FlhF